MREFIDFLRDVQTLTVEGLTLVLLWICCYHVLRDHLTRRRGQESLQKPTDPTKDPP
jgi:hypothetical protein